eukprot:TRINITY_DN1598_c0_g1_i1.p1 TRINITY_DN1598_c0_g1~~TRINITY_DN1598_c0_g1_i1.p1  ORF type:complete len:412 (+),score=18.69 TRINITY_DN1598_c0_g1_i1:56-1291(+)
MRLLLYQVSFEKWFLYIACSFVCTTICHRIVDDRYSTRGAYRSRRQTVTELSDCPCCPRWQKPENVECAHSTSTYCRTNNGYLCPLDYPHRILDAEECYAAAIELDAIGESRKQPILSTDHGDPFGCWAYDYTHLYWSLDHGILNTCSARPNRSVICKKRQTDKMDEYSYERDGCNCEPFPDRHETYNVVIATRDAMAPEKKLGSVRLDFAMDNASLGFGTTSAAGLFAVALPFGNFSVIGSKAGYRAHMKRFKVRANTFIEVFLLRHGEHSGGDQDGRPAACHIQGNVLDHKTQAPLKHVKITAIDESGEETEIKSVHGGAYKLSFKEPRTVIVNGVRKGYHSYHKIHTVTCGGRLDIPLHKRPINTNGTSGYSSNGSGNSSNGSGNSSNGSKSEEDKKTSEVNDDDDDQ